MAEKIRYTVETLYHFSCDKCKKWWSIADFAYWLLPHKAHHSLKKLTCPHCGFKSKLKKKTNEL